MRWFTRKARFRDSLLETLPNPRPSARYSSWAESTAWAAMVVCEVMPNSIVCAHCTVSSVRTVYYQCMDDLEALAAAAQAFATAEKRWHADRERLILQARANGRPWEHIADALGMSRTGVITIWKVAAAKIR